MNTMAEIPITTMRHPEQRNHYDDHKDGAHNDFVIYLKQLTNSSDEKLISYGRILNKPMRTQKRRLVLVCIRAVVPRIDRAW